MERMQIRLCFHDCNHIVEIVFVEIVFGTYPLSSCLSQTGLRFCDCNHIVEFAFVEFVSALPSKMNKATIVEDAITYIETQQNIVQSLSYELHEMEATSEEIKPKKEEIDVA
ncbi:hypothetical protein JHK87_030985 [Glycine soja]|nr:hypothetical protein JHK87_030985 [Glycine soja]